MFSLLKRQYVSDIGQFLNEFDCSHPEKSSAQQKEIAKHERIARLRDGVSAQSSTKDDAQIWKNF